MSIVEALGNKKRILYIITQSELGGAQKNALDLACGLKDKYEILVAAGPSYAKASAGKPDGGGDFFRTLKENGIRYIRLKFMRRAVKPLFDILAIFELKNLIKKERPDIVHLHSSKAGFLGALSAPGGQSARPKVVYTVHGAVFEAVFSPPVKKFYLWLEKFSAHFIDKIICVSANDKKLWLKYNAAPEEKLAVIYNGIDYQNLEFLSKEIARKELLVKAFSQKNPPSPPFLKGGLPASPAKRGEEEIFIGTIANFYPEKGLLYFIQTAEIILKQAQFKNVIFVVIGEGSQRELLEAMIKDRYLKNKFILTGKIDNASEYLKAFDIFVLPSVKEGLPYTILEAMAAGLPIIASYVGGIPEMIENEKNGFLVLPKNPEMLAEKISELLKNPELAQDFVKNSQIKLAEFSLEKMILETEALYKKCLGQ